MNNIRQTRCDISSPASYSTEHFLTYTHVRTNQQRNCIFFGNFIELWVLTVKVPWF